MPLSENTPLYESVSPEDRPSLAAVVLCGGRSMRMGADKAMVQLAGRTLLQHVVDRAAQACSQIVVVAAAEQTLPALPASVHVICDDVPDAGPLAGLLTGMRWLQRQSAAVSGIWLTGCDTPLVDADVVLRVASRLGEADAVAIECEGHTNPLLAVYRPSLLAALELQFAQGERSLSRCLNRLKARSVRAIDVASVSQLINVNTPEVLARVADLLGR
ncbi:MAG: molybdenum cofactor guanylyltransferase [Planctomycetaceae bacterium]|nr:molybdenum cofactor guanylyltransferase [Planctomycetaceae bacterium]